MGVTIGEMLLITLLPLSPHTMSDTNTNQEPVLTDEQILEFEQQIKDEEAQKVIVIHTTFIYQCI